MPKLLLGILLAGLAVGCAMEDQESSGVLTVDPNSDIVVPEGLSAEDVDLNNDRVIDIRDLVIASRFFGQELDEEIVPESCPAGEYREPILKVAGHSISNSGRLNSRDIAYRDEYESQGIKYRGNESCVKLYGNADLSDKTCLVSCRYRPSLLCYQKVDRFSKCKKCRGATTPPINWQRLPAAGSSPIKYNKHVESDDPTKCQTVETDVKYLFPASDEDSFYTYAFLPMVRYRSISNSASYATPVTSEYFESGLKDFLITMSGGHQWIQKDTPALTPSYRKVAVRLLVTNDRDDLIKELKVKAFPEATHDSLRDHPFGDLDKAIVETFEMKRFIDPSNPERAGKDIYFYEHTNASNYDLTGNNWQARLDYTNISVSLTGTWMNFYKGNHPVGGFHYQLVGAGIQIGAPIEDEVLQEPPFNKAPFLRYVTDTSVFSITFKLPPSFDAYRWINGVDVFGNHVPGQRRKDVGVKIALVHYMFPEEVRAKYFPEDIEE